ncbi:MAG: ribosomal RNA small subunit methyltransferase A [Candidatus Sungbacteria bacterium]|nr:ribosomal RNA small subunit methyltransferase A [Candidatus Sungbacteria bacterium]
MRPKKSLGQHFLRCNWVASTLVKAADLKYKDTVLEIGPGTGTLTRELAKHVGRVIAVEKDEILAENLQHSLANEGIKNVKVITADILKLLATENFSYKLQATSYKLVANIPYYLTSRLLRLLLEEGPRPELIVLTIQKEVAQRIVARPPEMNLLALSVQTFGRPEVIKAVPASCFWPKPKVDSAIIKISEISDGFFQKNSVDKKLFFEITRRAFSQKRKMLASSLRPYFSQHSVLTKIGLPEKARPQELSPQQWAKIVFTIEAKPL